VEYGWHGVDEKNMVHLSCGTYVMACLLPPFSSMDSAGNPTKELDGVGYRLLSTHWAIYQLLKGDGPWHLERCAPPTAQLQKAA